MWDAPEPPGITHQSIETGRATAMFALPKQPERPVVLVGSIGYLATPPASEVQSPPFSGPSVVRRRWDKCSLNELAVTFIKGSGEVVASLLVTEL